MKSHVEAQYSSKLAKALAALCVRNTFLEDLHAGKTTVSKTGNYSDVKVVTPDREIPWNELSRIDIHEMKKFMQEVVNRLYSVPMSLEIDEAMHIVFDKGNDFTHHWDEPHFLPNFLKPFVPLAAPSA